MKVEIWSDVVCPFCYIGKRKFETALQQFAHRDKIAMEWKSFQLMPDIPTTLNKSIDQVLSETKGISMEQARHMSAQATAMARQSGLDYHLEKTIVANTFRAHQFLHFAKVAGKQNQAKEMLFRAYFTEGQNIDDLPTLLAMGEALGLDSAALEEALHSGYHAPEVLADIEEARQIGINGVPFFVFDRKYAVSGAQDPRLFLQVLEQAYSEWEVEPSPNMLHTEEGAVCTPEGSCE